MNAVLAKNQAEIKQMRRHLADSGSNPDQPGRIILMMRLSHLIHSQRKRP